MERINEAGNGATGNGAAGNDNKNPDGAQRNRNNANPNVEIIREQAFEVGPRYHTLTYIGEGAYGMVV